MIFHIQILCEISQSLIKKHSINTYDTSQKWFWSILMAWCRIYQTKECLILHLLLWHECLKQGLKQTKQFLSPLYKTFNKDGTLNPNRLSS